MSTDGQGTKRRRKIAKSFNRLSRVHERNRQTTDRRDGRYVSSLFTFAKNRVFHFCEFGIQMRCVREDGRFRAMSMIIFARRMKGHMMLLSAS